MNVIRCDWCGNTYGEQHEWCPHCLAPRPVEHEQDEVPVITFYTDDVPYYKSKAIPDPYGTIGKR